MLINSPDRELLAHLAKFNDHSGQRLAAAADQPAAAPVPDPQPGKPGPNTEDGKAAVRLNAYKHGFAGQTVLLLDHEKEAYVAHFKRHREQFKPVGIVEDHYVQSLADLSFSLAQMRAMMMNATSITATYKPDENLADGGAHMTALTIRAQRLNELGVGPEKLIMYEQRKQNMYDKALKNLERVQSERKANEKAQLKEAMLMRRLTQKNPQLNEPAFDPSELGIVYSMAEIDLNIAREDRNIRLLCTVKKAA